MTPNEKEIRAEFAYLQKRYPEIADVELGFRIRLPSNCDGIYESPPPRILIHRQLLKNLAAAHITLRHEVAHALTGNYGHGKLWIKWARKLGIPEMDIQRHIVNPELKS